MTVRPSLKYRRNAAITVAALITLIGAVPLATQGWLFATVLVVPLAVAAWAWRSGTDVFQDRLVVRALLASRQVPWSAVTALVRHGDGVHAELSTGARLPLPAVPAADLQRLADLAQYSPVTTLSNGSPEE